MRIVIVAYGAFEEWDWRNPDTQGIGGSETAQIELARRLAKRGHDVTSYGPVPDDCTDDPNDGFPVKWRSHRELMKDPKKHPLEAEWKIEEPGHWIHFRHPAIADHFSNRQDIRLAQSHTLVCEDVVYNEQSGGSFTEERCREFDHILALCPTHAGYLYSMFPFMKEKLCIWSNGIETDRIREAFGIAFEQSDKPVPVGGWNEQRNPGRLIWASSPDRGLEALLHIFKRTIEFQPELELHCFYGFDNWDKFIGSQQIRKGVCLEEKTRAGMAREKFDTATGATVPDNIPVGVGTCDAETFGNGGVVKYKYPMEYGRIACPQEAMKKRITDLIDSMPENVFWHGRINQPRLWAEFAKSALWVYPTTFTETSCCTCMLAQALGAIPITKKYWAVGHNVQYGHFIDGDPMKDYMTRSRYVQAILHYVRQPELSEKIRDEMMPWARERFDWDNFAAMMDGWLQGAPHNIWPDVTAIPEEAVLV